MKEIHKKNGLINYGFGGAIIGETISSPTDLEYLRSRCRLLRVILNRRYTQFGIGEYSEKATKESEKREKTERLAKMMLEITAHDINRHIIVKVNSNKIKEYLEAKLHYFSIITKQVEAEDVDECFTLNILEEFKCLNLAIGVDWEKLNIEGDNEKFCTIKIAFFSVFENLIANSYNHSSKMEHTEIKVIVNKNDDKIKIKYSDNGKGFDRDALNSLTRWSEGELTEEEFNEDTGTGIFAVQNAINILGGKIEWPSEVGSTCIYLELPAWKWKSLYNQKLKKNKARPPDLFF
ncbi:MAG: ATP-binding protein [Nitrospirota bacterium]